MTTLRFEWTRARVRNANPTMISMIPPRSRVYVYLHFLRRGVINNRGNAAGRARGREEEKLILSSLLSSPSSATRERRAALRAGETDMNWLGTFSSSISFSSHPLMSTSRQQKWIWRIDLGSAPPARDNDPTLVSEQCTHFR